MIDNNIREKDEQKTIKYRNSSLGNDDIYHNTYFHCNGRVSTYKSQ